VREKSSPPHHNAPASHSLSWTATRTRGRGCTTARGNRMAAAMKWNRMAVAMRCRGKEGPE
jgi:hypothetical protein